MDHNHEMIRESLENSIKLNQTEEIIASLCLISAAIQENVEYQKQFIDCAELLYKLLSTSFADIANLRNESIDKLNGKLRIMESCLICILRLGRRELLDRSAISEQNICMLCDSLMTTDLILSS